jgi:hypothetical protein
VIVGQRGVEDVFEIEVLQVGLSGQPASDAADSVFYAAFLPWGMGVAEEGPDSEAMMLGELGSVVECQGAPEAFGQRLDELGEEESGWLGLARVGSD